MFRFSLFVFAFSISSIYGQVGNIHGIVKDADSKTVLPGANVVIKSTEMGAAADTSGKFKISQVPVGGYIVQVSVIGYETQTITDVFVLSNKTTYLDIKLKEGILDLGQEAVVYAGSYFTKKSEDITVSARSFNYEEIRRSPGAREDISRMIQNLPAVSPTSDDRNDLIVRGGSPSEVQFVVDNIEIPNPNHFGTQGASGGPVSLLNADLISEVTFLAGGFPVKYGSKMSGVIDITSIEGDRNRLSGKLDLGFGGAGLTMGGPLGGSKGTWLFSYRRSYLEIVEKLIEDVGGVPVYSNFQTFVTYSLGGGSKLSVLGVGGNDHIDIDYDPDKEDFAANSTSIAEVGQVENNTKQYTVGANLLKVWNEKWFSNVTVSHGYHRFFIDFNLVDKRVTRTKDKMELDIIEGSHFDAYENTSKEQQTDIKTDWTFLASKSTDLTFGVSTRLLKFEHNIVYVPKDTIDNVGGVPDSTNIAINQKSTPQYGAFFNISQKIGSKLSVNAGVRYDRFNLLSTNDISPRLGLSYKLSDRLTLNAGTGLYFQKPEFLYITGAPNNVSNLKSLRSEHYIFGVEYFPAEGSLFSVELYRKNYSRYPVAVDPERDFFTTANSGADYGSLANLELVSEGEGKAVGLELFFQQKLLSNWHGLVSLSISDVRHKALDGVKRRGEFDNRYVANIVLGYRKNKSWEVSLKWRYAGGRPYTTFDRPASLATGVGQLNTEGINSERYQSYHRLDLRYDHRNYYKNFTLVSYFSIENVYGRKNQGQVYWDKNARKVKFLEQTGFFPVGGFKLEL